MMYHPQSLFVEVPHLNCYGLTMFEDEISKLPELQIEGVFDAKKMFKFTHSDQATQTCF